MSRVSGAVKPLRHRGARQHSRDLLAAGTDGSPALDGSLPPHRSAKEAEMASKTMTRWVVALTAIGSLMAALDTLVVSTALTRIRLDLGASLGQLEWTVNAYNLSFAVLLITGAALGDRYGRRKLFAVGLGVFASASAAAALAPDVGVLIGARAAQGAGAALIMPLGLALLSAAFPAEKRGAAIGIFSAITGISVASGPLVGGAVVQGIDWQWIFWVNVPIGLATIPLVVTKMKESHGPDTGLDLRGLALVTLGTLATVWGLVRGNQVGWGSGEVVGSLLAGVLLMIAFVAWERRAREPMLPLELFRSRAFSAGNAAIFLTFASLFSAGLFYAHLLPNGLGYGPLETGLRLLPWPATFTTIAPLAGALADRIGERPLMVTGLSLQALGMAWLALIAETGMSYTELLGPFIVAGVGGSMGVPAAPDSGVTAGEDEALGEGAGADTTRCALGRGVRPP